MDITLSFLFLQPTIVQNQTALLRINKELHWDMNIMILSQVVGDYTVQ